MLGWVNATLRPAAYHGFGARPPFFEGWYFKVLDKGGMLRYAVIPGIYKSSSPGESHAFIQVSDGVTGCAAYQTFPPGEFSFAKGEFDISIGKNRFSTEGLRVDIRTPELGLSGELRFLSPVPWPVTPCAPGVMGWYAWMPFMECYHGVVSMDHGIQGGLDVNGKHHDFSGGRGYTEKDWGRSFPSAWIWMQSNHFPRPGTGITASMAVVPWIGRSFAGFTAGFLHEGRLLRFATYTGASVEELSITDRLVAWVVQDKRHRLEISAERTRGSLLRAPTVQAMDRRITETLTSSVEVRLLARGEGGAREVFHETGMYAGLEAAGDTARMERLWKRERKRSR